MILPFTFAELLVLGVALLIYARHASDYEKIRLNGTEFTIELFLGNRRTLKHWNAPWVRVKDPEPNVNAKKHLVVLEMGKKLFKLVNLFLPTNGLVWPKRYAVHLERHCTKIAE